MLTAGAYCKSCAKKNKTIKVKAVWLENIDNTARKKEILQRRKETCLLKYGTEHVSQNKYVKEKKKQTTFLNYGVEFPSQSSEIKEKKKNSSLARFGVEYPSQSKEVQEKVKNTFMEKYGGVRASHREDFKEKVRNTSLDRYGTTNAMKNESIKEKYKQGCLLSFGYESPLQDPKISEKMFKSCVNLKDYTLPSKTVIQMQGYEHFGMDELLHIENIDENDIITSRKKVPEVWYEDTAGKKHRYFVDFYIPSQNRCIEVKSSWTVKKENVFEKQQAMKDQGYQCEIWVYDDKGVKLKCYK